MSTFKYPFIALIFISIASTLWFSSRLVRYSTLLVDKWDEQSQIIPFYRNSIDSSELSSLLHFIDETATQAKKFVPELISERHNMTHVFSTAIRNSDDIQSFNILHRYLLDMLPSDFSIVVFFFDKALQSELLLQTSSCNVTFGVSRCWLRHVDLMEYSTYIAKNVMYQLYKPLLIRLLLLEYDVAVWLDPLFIPTARFELMLKSLVVTGEKRGAVFLSATHGLPTSAFTHVDTFKYFGLKPEAFYFYRMISSRFFILARTNFMFLNITDDWLRCCADPDCVWPLGSRSAGCVSPQPEYKYRGCHAGEQSALNIAIYRLTPESMHTSSSQLIYHASDSPLWFVSVQNWNKTTEYYSTTVAQHFEESDFDGNVR